MNATTTPSAPEVKPPPKITIDGVTVEFTPGESIMNVAERMKISESIPRYCYHPGLSIAGSCRMCQVEVEKAPKLMTSCSTPAGDGMVVHTQSEKVQKSRTGVMETLLANHPLDCPVCDQAGECKLQDYNFEYGPSTSKMAEDKRVFENKSTYKLSDELTLNMNRCIHCERCIRFTEDVTQTNELIMVGRGWRKQIVTSGNLGIKNDYQGCISEICPVGAFTYSDFRFKKRVWFLRKKPTICDGCSKGCNIFADTEKETVYRLRARENKDVNSYWMCDEGRKSFHVYEARITSPHIIQHHALVKASWTQAVTKLTESFVKAKTALVVIGTDVTNEEALELQKRLPEMTQAKIEFRFLNGVNGVSTSSDDQKIDTLLKRKDKTPNTKGLESLGLKPLTDADKNFDVLLQYRSGRAAVVTQDRATVQIAFGVYTTDEAKHFQVVLPGTTTYEKSGTYINCDGREQRFTNAIKPNSDVATVTQVMSAMKEILVKENWSSHV